MQLPAPVEQLPNSANSGNTTKSNELGPAAPESTGTAMPAMPTSIPLPMPPTLPASLRPTSMVSSIGTQGNPALASDDSDLIEKEWVNKAKQIVEQTKDNPYQQSEELTVFKADYMKKRYNRAIRLK